MSRTLEKDATTQPALVRRPAGELSPAQDLWEYAQAYAREKPDMCALWCFGVGFVLGWKLKPW